MADGALKVNLSTLVKGMDQINREKKEINQVMNFLGPVLRKITRNDQCHIKRARAQFSYRELIWETVDENGNRMSLSFCMHEGYKITFSLDIAYKEHCKMREVNLFYSGKKDFGAEQLSGGDTCVVHGFLQPLINMVLTRQEKVDEDRFRAFLDAAERAK